MNPALLLAAIAAAAYLPSLAGPFQFDDYNVVAVHSWTLRPLLKATYAINGSPFAFHLVSIALHSLNTALIFFVGKELIRKEPIRGQGRNYSFPIAFGAALLFALHPMQTEAVTYISGRSSSLMASFYLAAMLAYLRERPWPIPALLFVLALATRETAVTLPAALLLAEVCRGTPWRDALRRQASLWLLLVAAAAVILFTPRYYDLVAYGFRSRSLADNLLTQVGGVSYLLWHLVTLQGLNIDPALPTQTQWTGTLVFQASALALLMILATANLRQRRWLAFGILWFFLQLAPTNSFVPRLDVANDRQVYLACWGFFFGVITQLSSVDTRLLWRGASALSLVFLLVNVTRQLDYRDEITLWEATVREAPWNARAHNNLGFAYYEAGRKADARREMETALFLDPKLDKARANLALLDWN